MLWLILSLVVIASSPIGRALADRMAGRVPARSPEREALQAMEHRIAERVLELEDRLDATEQLLERPPGFGPGRQPDAHESDETIV